MLTKIRDSIASGSYGKLSGEVEMDETYYGPYVAGASGPLGKTPIVGMLQRNGLLIATTAPDASRHTLLGIMNKNIAKHSTVYTDEYIVYQGVKDYVHKYCNHSKGVYSYKGINTNSVEGFWSHLKRGLKGTNHFVSDKHLQKYVKEYEFRYNTRAFSDDERFNSLFGYLFTKYKSHAKIVANEEKYKLKSFFSEENGF